MKLSSPPTRWALTSVVAAAMKYGPTKVPRMAYELDMPVETCRYYLKKFYEAGFRLQPVVDYWALGLAPTVTFIRFDRRVPTEKKQTLLSWLDTVYVVYRAPLANDREHIILTVPPKGDEDALQEMLEMLKDANLVENYFLAQITDGYYRPEWITVYDFRSNKWCQKLEIEVPNIPVSDSFDAKYLDRIDLLLLEEIEAEPTMNMKKISFKHNISPQLISYHRQKHIDAKRLITGFVPVRRTAQGNVNILFVNHRENEVNELNDYFHSSWKLPHENLSRFHLPDEVHITSKVPVHKVDVSGVVRFTIPTEHHLKYGWLPMATFVEQLESLTRVVA